MTLVELVVAGALTVLVAGATAGLIRGMIAVRSRADRQELLQQEARAAIGAIATALHNAYRSARNDWVLEGSDEWRGDWPADRVRFFAVSTRAVRAGQPESDVRECEFWLSPAAADRLPALLRRTDPTRNDDPDGGGVVEQVATHIVALDFAYRDASGWQDRWQRSRRDWPRAIRVDLVAAAETRPVTLLRVSRTVNFPYRPARTQEGSP
jgi:hypothetical protein